MKKLVFLGLCCVFSLFAISEAKASLELFTLGWSGDYVRFDATTGEIKNISLGLPGRPGGIARSTSDDFYFITYGDFGGPKGLYHIDPITGYYEYVCRTSNIYEIFGIAFAPSGTLYVNEYLYSDLSYLGTIDIKSGTFTRINRVTGDAGHLSKMSFSPDGQLYGSDGHGIYIVSTGNAATTQIADSGILQFITGICFTPDGSFYVAGYDFGSSYPDYNYCFAEVDISTGQVISKTALPSLAYPETTVGVIESVPEPVIGAEVEIYPNTLNLKSKGKWITFYIWLPEDYDVADIDPNTILLEDEIEPKWLWFVEDQQVVMAKFNRSDVRNMLVESDQLSEIELTLNGKLVDGTNFSGSNVIRVLNKPAIEKP